MPRTKKEFGTKRNNLLTKIWDIFLVNGYENTTLALILKELSISKGVFYHYFNSKEECADLSIEMHIDLCINQMLEQDLSGLEADKKLVHMILFGVGFFHNDSNQEARINAPANAVFHQKLMIAATKQLAPVYSEVISEGIREQLFDTEYPLEAAEMILSLANFYLDADLFQWKPETMQNKLYAFAGTMDRILGAKRGTFNFISSMM